ncbi:NAD(P)-dependent dehydrogenase (short-subunit alcohol dehydrogenase family) [Povalibacter uvarum]|uniref:NAD(P)-dependent dehydrogenase (Short-subunit alcohol dehydrogenase family) n=1 Tax=Povalibacter uvarum TaxID=732238 RepID=A0A841HQB2_9GAMM|nr:SDR family NAD(P)-dependent oxidoreductase [Povalibacter uvarum]MBB6094420.1 NAD(P)-dependent dehydrogenase (short-subunit alcohol dehydrogenase family) [Povalibacter uvarum]
MKLNQVRAVITGGASGLGNAVAAKLVAGGAKVTLLDVNQAAGEAAAQALGDAATFQTVDVTSETAVNEAIAAARASMGSINLAVNCAGVAWARRLVNKEGPMPGDFFRKVVEVNLVGTLQVAKAAAAAMGANTPNEEGERGLIVMTASVAAFDGQIGQVAYSASKGGVVGMTLPMARDLASSGIRVMTIAPGIFKTPMMAAMPQETQDSLGRQVPFPPRLGRPEEYAALVAHICENIMLNGECIRLDGAIRMAPK